MVTTLKHAQDSIKLYLNGKGFKFYRRRDFCSSIATAYDTAFFNIKFFYHLFSSYFSKIA